MYIMFSVCGVSLYQYGDAQTSNTHMLQRAQKGLDSAVGKNSLSFI